MHARIVNDKEIWEKGQLCSTSRLREYRHFFLSFWFLFFSVSSSSFLCHHSNSCHFSFLTKALLLHRRTQISFYLSLSRWLTVNSFAILFPFYRISTIISRFSADPPHPNFKSRARSFCIRRVLLTLAVASSPVRHLWTLTFPRRLLQALNWPQRKTDCLLRLFVFRKVFLLI